VLRNIVTKFNKYLTLFGWEMTLKILKTFSCRNMSNEKIGEFVL